MKRGKTVTRDIVVIGASAGAVIALRDVLKGLSANFSGRVFIVLHTGRTSSLPKVLQNATLLPVRHAVDGERIERGSIIVAPPDQHLLLSDHHVILSRGPRQNNVRPAVDPLFSSAARAHGPRVVGVVLSGTLDDGSAGLLSIKEAGGVAIVQHPDEAVFPEMPSNAMATVQADYVLTASEIGLTLNELAVGGKNVGRMKKSFKVNAPPLKIMEMGETSTKELPPGQRTELTCPQCGGTLWEMRKGRLLRFACHTGHTFSSESLADAQETQVENAMWIAMRSLKERAIFLKKLSEKAQRERQRSTAARYENRAREFEEQATVIQKTLLGIDPQREH